MVIMDEEAGSEKRRKSVGALRSLSLNLAFQSIMKVVLSR
jgi:hypothetical protein